MATAQQLRMEFTDQMNKYGTDYTVIDVEDNVVRLRFAARADKEGGGTDTAVCVDFDEQGDQAVAVHFSVQRFASCGLDDMVPVVLRLNELNRQFRWCKVWLEELAGTCWLTADADARITPGSAGDECIMMCVTLSDIVEDMIIELGDLVEVAGGVDDMRQMMARLSSLPRVDYPSGPLYPQPQQGLPKCVSVYESPQVVQ